MVNLAAIVKAVDAVMAVRDAARSFKSPPPDEGGNAAASPMPQSRIIQPPAAPVDARLANIVVAALKEAFDRDHARLELERTHLEAERQRAEAAMRLELHRQAADRELSRLRLLAGAALVGWIASVIMVAAGIAAASVAARVTLAAGWLLLLGSLGAAFAGQRRVGAFVPDGDRMPEGGWAAAASPWMLVAGLAATAISLLL